MAGKHSVEAQGWNGVLVEGYWFAPDVDVDLPKHTHDEYQLGLALTHPGEYFYRRGYHPVPVHSISVIHPGECHSGCGFRKRNFPIEFRSFYIPPQRIERLLAELTGKHHQALPFLSPITLNASWDQTLRKIYDAVMCQETDLELHTLWDELLSEIFCFNRRSEFRRDPEPQAGVSRVREFLDASPEKNISLEELAAIAALTPSHLSRAFHQKVGMPLHRYQAQRRIDRAKQLLIRGEPPSEVALLTGFAHQSHFGKYFRELVQTTPAAYQANSRQKRKNVISQRA